MVSDCVSGDARPESVDGAGKVAGGYEWEAVLHLVFEVALKHGVVERIQSSGGHTHSHFALGGLRFWHVVNRAGLTEGIKSECAHGPLLLGGEVVAYSTDNRAKSSRYFVRGRWARA